MKLRESAVTVVVLGVLLNLAKKQCYIHSSPDHFPLLATYSLLMMVDCSTPAPSSPCWARVC